MEIIYDFSIVSNKKLINSLDQEYKTKFEQQVKTINISGNSYSLEFCQEFGKCLLQQNQIEILNMNDVFVSRLKDEIPQSLSSIFNQDFLQKNLQKLDLSNNAISINGAKALEPYLQQANSLQTFIINNCGLGIHGSTIISNALQLGTPNLQIWAMSRNRIEDQGALQVSLTLQNLRKIKELYIYQNFIRNDGMLKVFQELINCQEIKIIDVQDNYVKGETAKQLCLLIKSNKNIKCLNLSDCNIQEDENDLILESMSQSQSQFEKIGYNYNELNSKQAKSLLDILLKNKDNLKRLDIKGNEFKKATKKHYNETFDNQGLDRKILSKFDSDSEEEDELVSQFSNLQI